MSTGINVTKQIKILDEGVLLTSDVSQIDFTGGVTATTVGNNVTVNVPAAGITVGTTPVTSGTDGRVFFQAGGVVQQDANFTFDNTLKRLTLKAVGTAGTDIPFAVQNSVGTANLIDIKGDNNTTFYQYNAGLTNNSLNILNVNADTAARFDLGGVSTFNFVSLIQTKATAAGQGVPATANFRGFLYASNANGNHFVISANDGIAFSGQNPNGYNATSDQMRLKNGNLAIGTGYSASARLDVKAQGALSTDIAFRVRNSADNDNLIESAGNGLVKFRTGTERIEINTSASDYKMSLYKFGVEMTKLSTYSSYFCVGGSNQYLGVGTSGPSHLLDINTVGVQKQIVTRFGNEFNSTTQSDVSLKFTTAYCGGGFGGNPLAYLTVGNNGGVGVNNNAKSYFKFELLKNNTLAERASITSQSNLLLQAPTEDTNDVGVIYIPNGTAPTVALAGGGKLYVEGGALKFIGSSGTVSVIAPA